MDTSMMKKLAESIVVDPNAKELEEFEVSLPREKAFVTSRFLYLYQNFWCPSLFLRNIISFQAHFQAQDTNILVASKPKSGTIWLKSLAFTILNRGIYPTKPNSNTHPLTTTNAHQLVPFIETSPSNVSECPPPRLFATHIPYNSLPESVKSSGCRIIYICRNPLDTVVSLWKFSCRAREEAEKKNEHVETLNLEELVDLICRGVDEFGPHWDHVLGYWRESLKNPNKVLFLKFEDMKANEKSEVKRLAEFMGCPFTAEEEETGVIQDISRLCSIDFLKELDVNKFGKSRVPRLSNDMFFRKGEVGDWANHLSPAVAERLNQVMLDKFHGSGLTFKTTT